MAQRTNRHLAAHVRQPYRAGSGRPRETLMKDNLIEDV